MASRHLMERNPSARIRDDQQLTRNPSLHPDHRSGSEPERPSRFFARQMVLSDRNDRARLRSFFTFARVHGKAHLVSHGQSVEAFVGDGVPVEVDFHAVA